MKNKKHFRSCFIVDITVTNNVIILIDSIQNKYFIDIKNSELVIEFKNWFKNVFSAGIAQTLTLFEYDIVDVSECEVELHIVKFLNKQYTEKTLLV